MMKTTLIFILLLLSVGCTSREEILERVQKDETNIVSQYAEASHREALDVLHRYLTLIDKYDVRGWNEKGIKTDAIRAMTEARLAAIYQDMGQQKVSDRWMQRAVEHQHAASGSTNTTADKLLQLVESLDENISPQWRNENASNRVPVTD